MTTQKPQSKTHYSPAILSLLPLLYVAWSDRTLTRSELELLKEKMATLKWLSQADRTLLLRWGNPKNPPSPELFHQWAGLIHATASSMDRERREGLAELGVAMADRADDDSPSTAAFAKTLEQQEGLKAIKELEAILGEVDKNTLDTVFTKEGLSTSEKAQYTFDVDAMRHLLDDDYVELRDEMRTLLSQKEFAYPTSLVKEDHRAVTMAQTRRLGELGYGIIAMPKEYGGEDAFGKYSAVFEMLGYHDGSLAIKFGVQFGLFGGSIANLGTEYHHRNFLEAAGRLELPGCFAMTETGHGSNVRGLETTITFLPETQEFEIHSPHWGAGKEYIGNAMDSKMATVFGQLIVDGESQGVHAILVPLRDADHNNLPGITVEDCGDKIGLNGVDNGRIWFKNVRVPRLNLLNRFGDVDEAGTYTSPIENPGKRFFTMLGTLVGGRVCVPRAGLSAAKAGLAIAINYGLRRRQFSPAANLPETLLLDYPSHQRRLLPVLAKAYALDFALDWLNDRYGNRTPDTMRELESQAAGMKAYATWFTTSTLQECREACGGKGYLLANRIGQRKGDTEIYTTFEGDNTVLSYLVSRALLTKFKNDFNAEGAFGVLRLIAGRVSDQFTALSPISVRSTDSDHLRDAEFHMDAMRFRENRMIYSLAQRIRRKIKGGMPSAEAFTLVQTQLKDTAMAYVERVVLEQFQAKVESVTAPELKAVLSKLCTLFALEAIEKDKGWFFEYDFLSPAKSKAIRREVDTLCKEVRPHAAGLVDAFGIPKEVLGAQVV
ncbi:MAG: acyl-CoA dehydrogenase [Saprospiraceae bacterium]